MEVNNTETAEVVKLSPFEIEKAELQALAKDYDNLVVTPETYQDAKKAVGTLREKRYSIQNTLKINKGALNKLKSDQEEKADALIAIIEPTENKINAGIKQIDDIKEAEKKRKEEEAQKKIADRNAALSGYEMRYDNGTYTLGDHSISAVQIKVFSDQEFEEFLTAVKAEYQKILDLRAEAERLKKEEQERLEKQRLDQEAERKRLEAIAEEQRQKELAIQAEQDRANKLALQRQEEERKALEAEQEKIRAEKEAILQEKRNARIYQLEEMGLQRNRMNNGFVYEDIVIGDEEINTFDIRDWTDLIGITKKKISFLVEQKEKALKEEMILDERKGIIESLRISPVFETGAVHGNYKGEKIFFPLDILGATAEKFLEVVNSIKEKLTEIDQYEKPIKNIEVASFNPDKGKIAAFMASLMAIEYPEVVMEPSILLMDKVKEKIKEIESFVAKEIEQL